MRLSLPRKVPEVPYTKGEVAALLDLSPAQVSRLCRRGLLTVAGDGVISLRAIARYVGRTHKQNKLYLYERVKRAIEKAKDVADESAK